MTALVVAWRSGDDRHGVWGPVGRLEFDDPLFRFYYTRGARTLLGFQPFPQMEDVDQIYESETLFPIFANRLLSPSRTEYEALLRWGGFDPDNPPNPIAILGITEGIRQTDSVEVFPCPVPDAQGCFVYKFFLHGLRWITPEAKEALNRLQPGEGLRIEREPSNAFDSHAVAVFSKDSATSIGYVPRYLARDVGQLLHGCDSQFISLTVERINPDAPLQQRLLCRMQSCWPDNFTPCSGDEFLPIPEGLQAHCG